MLSLFNQLTSKELADCDFFNNLITLHYEKFKYLYYILKDVDFENIIDICCNDETDNISVTLISIDAATLYKYINEHRLDYPKQKYFKTSLLLNDNSVVIGITMLGFKKEVEMYASGLI